MLLYTFSVYQMRILRSNSEIVVFFFFFLRINQRTKNVIKKRKNFLYFEKVKKWDLLAEKKRYFSTECWFGRVLFLIIFLLFFCFNCWKREKKKKKNNEKQNGIGKKWYLSVEFWVCWYWSFFDWNVIVIYNTFLKLYKKNWYRYEDKRMNAFEMITYFYKIKKLKSFKCICLSR